MIRSLLPSSLKHTYPHLTAIQSHAPCFNDPFSTCLKHTHPVLEYLQCLTPCFNYPFNTRLKHTYPVLSHLLGLTLCFNAEVLPEGKRNPLGPLMEPERVSASRLAAYCKAVVPCSPSRRTCFRAAASFRPGQYLLDNQHFAYIPRRKRSRGLLTTY